MTPHIQFLSKLPVSGYGTTEMRCVQPAQYLGEAGWAASVGCVYRDMPNATRAILFHRVTADPMGLRAINIARRKGLRVLYDVDDLIFDVEGAGHIQKNTKTNTPNEIITRTRRAMMLCDAVLCSTTFLRDRAAEFHPNVVVVKNGISRHMLDIANRRVAQRRHDEQEVILGYFSGSRHHDADFSLLQPHLMQIMQNYPFTRLLLVGKLNYDPALQTFGDRVEYRPFVPYAQFMTMPGEVDINLVPLIHTDPFAQARSELKYIEAGVFGVPTIASPTPTYREVIADGKNGMICSPRDWYVALSRVITDTHLRRRLGAAARQDVIENYGPAKRSAQWDKLFADITAAPEKQPRSRSLRWLELKQASDIHRRSLRRWVKSVR